MDDDCDKYNGGSSDDEAYEKAYYRYMELIEVPDCSSQLSSASSTVIRKGSILNAQKEELEKVMDLLAVKEHLARTLLIHYRWNTENLLGTYVEKGREYLYAEAGLSVLMSENYYSSQSLTEVTCEICFDNVPAEMCTTMDCGHCFCNSCWINHFTVKINEGQSKCIKCMAEKCNAICNEEKIRNLVGVDDPELARKFDRFLLESYIDDNRRVKWCPSVPHCGNAIRVGLGEDVFCEVQCPCGEQFCFNCLSEPHSPCSCLIWELWMNKVKDDSLTLFWFSKHAKYCPKCNRPVEKNGGCNRVRCMCGQTFCWLCGARDLNESMLLHFCGRYTEEEEEPGNIDPGESELSRFAHYYGRYGAHLESLRLEEKLLEKLKWSIDGLEEEKQAMWMMKGFDRLFKTRKILSRTYAFSFYMFGPDRFPIEMSKVEKETKQTLFEIQQELFESYVENLSLLLERSCACFDKCYHKEMESRVTHLSSVIDKLCKKMFNCIEYDLLGIISHTNHIITSYSSKGIQIASEFCSDLKKGVSEFPR